jgi:hypothetical protein
LAVLVLDSKHFIEYEYHFIEYEYDEKQIVVVFADKCTLSDQRHLFDAELGIVGLCLASKFTSQPGRPHHNNTTPQQCS